MSVWVVLNFLNQISNACALCMLQKTECGNPGIRKSMFTSFSIVCSWLESSWFTTGLPRSLTKCFVSNVESHAFMTRTCFATIWHIFLCLFRQRVAPFDHVPVQRWDSYCRQMNVFVFYSFPQRVAPFYPKKQLLREKNWHRSPWERDVLLPSCIVLVSSNNGLPPIYRF